MSLLNPKSDFDDADLKKVMFNDFDQGLQIIQANIQQRLNELYIRETIEDMQRIMTNVTHDAFFEFAMHWKLEYQIHCVPIAKIDCTPEYLITISFQKGYSFDIQSISIHVNT